LPRESEDVCLLPLQRHPEHDDWVTDLKSRSAMTDEYDIEVTELDEETCWRLLARAGFGRVGFVDVDDELAVLPVNAGVHNGRVIFRTAEGASVARRGDGSMVAFEADHTDHVAEAGWSVLVRGRLWDVSD